MQQQCAAKRPKVGILGATGAVGRQMLQVLQQRRFPLAELRLLAGPRSAGMQLPFDGELLTVRAASPQAFAGLDIVLGAAANPVAQQYAPAICEAGAVFIDNSSAFRLRPEVPLVVPEINAADIRLHKGLIANPNCSTIITLTAVHALHAISPIQNMVAVTYQAVSGAGAAGLQELRRQLLALRGGPAAQCQVFPYPIACNLIPQIGPPAQEGYTAEEMKMQNEGRRILHAPQLQVSCTCVRVPVMRSHSIAVAVRTAAPIPLKEARRAIAAAAGCRLVDDLPAGRYPMPLEASEQDLVLVGRIRRDLTDPRGLLLWCCGDQLRKGAATNAVQIAELV